MMSAKMAARRGDPVVGLYGDELLNITLPGDGYRGKHNAIQNSLAACLKWAGRPVETEVLNLLSHHFTPLARQRAGDLASAASADYPAGGQRHYDRAKQVVVPDFDLGSAEGARVVGLAELKTLSCGHTTYPGAPLRRSLQEPKIYLAKVKPVEVRAKRINGEYVAKIVNVEGGSALQPGPALQHFNSLGGVKALVVGGYGEANEVLHTLISEIVKARCGIAMSSGVNAQSAGYAYVRGRVGMAALRADARHKVDATQWVGEGAYTAAARRAQSIDEANKARNEFEAMRMLQTGQRHVAVGGR